MQARGVSWAFLSAWALAGACGSDPKPSFKDHPVGGDDDPSGGGTKPNGGSTSGNGGSKQTGKGGSTSGTDQGGTDAVEAGSAGMAGEGGAVEVPGPKPIQFTVVGNKEVH